MGDAGSVLVVEVDVDPVESPYAAVDHAYAGFAVEDDDVVLASKDPAEEENDFVQTWPGLAEAATDLVEGKEVLAWVSYFDHLLSQLALAAYAANSDP